MASSGKNKTTSKFKNELVTYTNTFINSISYNRPIQVDFKQIHI